MAIIAFAVYLFVSAGIVRGAYSRLLQENDYHPDKKALLKKIKPFIGVYWLVATSIYLAYSFITMDWQRSWITWPVAGFYSALCISYLSRFTEKKRNK